MVDRMEIHKMITSAISGDTRAQSMLTDLLSKIGGNVEKNNFPSPDYENAFEVLPGNGTFITTQDGYVQRRANINNPSTVYAEFKTTINDHPAFDAYYAGLLPSGLYTYTAHPTPVKNGDIVVTTTNGNGITNTLWFIPIKE